jgi:hypothetical protein
VPPYLSPSIALFIPLLPFPFFLFLPTVAQGIWQCISWNRSFAWWRCDTTTTRILFVDSFVTLICYIILVLSEKLKHLRKNIIRKRFW